MYDGGAEAGDDCIGRGSFEEKSSTGMLARR